MQWLRTVRRSAWLSGSVLTLCVLTLCLFTLCLGVSACTVPSDQQQPVPDDLEQYVLSAAPRDVATRNFIDFGGKVHLLGYTQEPSNPVTPGSQVTLRLYWKSVAKLADGWRLFSHLEHPDGSFENLDQQGPLRQADGDGKPLFPPSAWQPGRYYVDEQTVTVPDKGQTFSLLVGVWRKNQRLDVLSGPADGVNRGVVTTLRTK